MTGPQGRAVPAFEDGGVWYDAVEPAATTCRGPHYDYRAQVWREGHDHQHISSTAPEAPPLYCGADLETCAPTTPPDAAASTSQRSR